MTLKKLSCQDFGIRQNNIIVDLSKYYNSFTNSQKSSILKSFISTEDYVRIMYWLKFICILDYNEIAQKLNISKSQVYKRYDNLTWNYSGTFEDNEKLHAAMLNELSSIKEQAFNFFSNQIIPELNNLYIRNHVIRSDSYIRLGFEDFKQYINSLYFMLNECKLTTGEIALILNCNIGTLEVQLKKLGLCRDRSSVQKNIVDRNRRDYVRVFSSSRKTVQKFFLKNGLLGSTNENWARTFLDSILGEYFEKTKYEVVIGINSHIIISPKEVDIPIIIINFINNRFYKFALEYNGDAFHNDEKDEKKKNLLLSKGWIYIPILEYGNTRIQKEFGDIEKQLRESCITMRDYILEQSRRSYSK
jgi:hypothetical protein